MKTPRDILLAHHQAAEPQLDAIRDAVLRELGSRTNQIHARSQCASPPRPSPSYSMKERVAAGWERKSPAASRFNPQTWFQEFLTAGMAGVSLWRRGLLTLWRELILPSRRTWTGLAAVWLLLLIANVAQRDSGSVGSRQPRRATAAMMSWQVQQRWMDELLADRSVAPERPPLSPARPRTEETEMMAA